MTIKAMFGLHVLEKLDLSIRGESAGAEKSTLTITRRGAGVDNVAAPSSWSLFLGPGDYILHVKGDVQGPFAISATKRAAIATVDADGASPTIAIFWATTFAVLADPKVPWPELTNADAGTPPPVLKADVRAWFEEHLLPSAMEAAARGPG